MSYIYTRVCVCVDHIGWRCIFTELLFFFLGVFWYRKALVENAEIILGISYMVINRSMNTIPDMSTKLSQRHSKWFHRYYILGSFVYWPFCISRLFVELYIIWTSVFVVFTVLYYNIYNAYPIICLLLRSVFRNSLIIISWKWWAADEILIINAIIRHKNSLHLR